MRFLPLICALSVLLIPVACLAGSSPGEDASSSSGISKGDKAPMSLELIFGDRKQAPQPSQTRWTTDNRLSYFLKAEKEEGSESDPGRDLWILDYSTGKKEILLTAEELQSMAPSPDQATSDERERTRRTRFNVAAYLWSPDGRQILFSSSGKLLLHTLETGKTVVLAPKKEGVLDPKFSPDGQSIAFVYEHDIWVVPVDGGPERRLTTGGHELLLHGDLDWVYPEEFRVRTGYHFSPDSRYIAFMESDQSVVPTYPITEKVSWQATVDLQRYPKPGDPNPKVRIGIVDVEKARTVWLDRSAEYIPRFQWADAQTLAVQLLDRAQEELELVLANPTNGRSKSVFFERDTYWINVRNDLTFLEGSDEFLWTSDRSGMRHLYVYNRKGEQLRTLTEGEYQVTAVHGVDAEGRIYYSSNEHNLLGSDLYRMRRDGSKNERLTREDGSHRIQMNDQADAYIDSFSSWTEPGGRRIHDLGSGNQQVLSESADEREEFDWVEPEMHELKTEDGELVRMMLFAPEKVEPGEKRPVLVYVYGMPGFPVIRNSWIGGRRGLFHQFLVQEGYVVAYIDDRSASIPGHKHAAKADHNIGPVAAEDHRVAVDFLKTLPYVDPERFAIWGWSGGGFTTAFHMGHTDLFKAGIAGAPPTDWRLYDSIYTERYMGHPDEVPEAYERTSAINGAENVEGRLLLIHGTHDDNVHPQNTIKMMDALVRAGKQFDVMLYPNKTHGISGKAHRLHMYTMIFEHLKRHL